MSAENLKTQKIQALIEKLVNGHPIHLALAETGISAGRARQMLRGRRARRITHNLKALHHLQKSLMLEVSAPRAVNAITEQLNSEKPNLQLQGALSLLKLTTAPPPKKSRPCAQSKTKKELEEAFVTENYEADPQLFNAFFEFYDMLRNGKIHDFKKWFEATTGKTYIIPDLKAPRKSNKRASSPT